MRTFAMCCLALTLLAVGPAAPAAQRERHEPQATERLVRDAMAVPGTRAATAGTDAARPTTRSRYSPPLPAPLELHRAFDAPRERWGPGHRGIDLGAEIGAAVLAPGPGTVSFAGTVAGRGVVTISHPDGLRSSLEPVSTSLSTGDPVRGGDAVGVVASTAGHCAPSSCVHWGVRDGETYVDPLLVLRGGPSVLLPGP